MAILLSCLTRRRAVLLLLGAILATTRLAAQDPVPRLLSYQGVLSDKAHTAVVDGRYTVTFRIYDGETGGAMLWEETTVVETINGVFETLLGSRTPLSLPFNRPYWLGVQLQGDAEMSPRMQFVSTPYAMRALESENALQLDPDAIGVVHTLNGLDGNLVLVGEGQASVRISGDTLAVVVPGILPTDAKDGQYIRWNSRLGVWEAVDPAALATTPRLAGDGSPAAPLDIAQMGAADGQPLVWDETRKAWGPGASAVRTESPLKGDGAIDPIGIQDGTADRQALIWDAASGSWRPAEQQVVAAGELSGTGTSTDPLRLAQQGASGGEVLRWDETSRGWRPGPAINVATPPLKGTGSPDDPLRFADGQALGQLLFWDGAKWTGTTARAPRNGEHLRWNGITGVWEPAGLTVSDVAPLAPGSLWYGSLAGTAAELRAGTRNQVLVVDPSGSAPMWTSNLDVDSIAVQRMAVSGDMSVGGTLGVAGTTSLEGDLRVKGPAVDLPAGSVDNAELAHSSIDLMYAPGVAGDAQVSLGDTLHLRNTGVISATGTANQVIVSNATGDITLSLPQDIHTGATPTFAGIMTDSITTNRIRVNGDASVGGTLGVGGATSLGGDLTVAGPGVNLPAGSVDNAELANSSIDLLYGAGVAGDPAVSLGDTLHLRNTGVISATGTANQVIVSNATGDVTLSLPQDIHTGATPTFGGIIVDSLRTKKAGIDGDLDVAGSTRLGGSLAVTGPEVNLPAGSVDNAELAHSSIDLMYGAGVAGDPAVSLGDTLHLRNTGVISATGTANQVIVDRSTGDVTLSLPQDIHTGATPTFAGIMTDSITTNRIRVNGDASVGGTLGVGGATSLGGNLTVAGPEVNLPAGSVDNAELAHSSIDLMYGAGVAGDPAVSLGDTLHLRNTGVTSATGTANQVIVSNATGDITLSLPQDIHTGATPTFAGIMTDSITTNRIRVNSDASVGGTLGVTGATSLGGDLTVVGPGVNLPGGSVDNAELAHSSIDLMYGAGVAGDPAVSLGDTLHLRNTGVTSATGTANQVIVDRSTGDVTFSLPQDIHTGATPTFGGIIVDSLRTKKAGIDGDLDVAGATRLGGSLTVTGPEVNLPAGSVDNAELANSSIGLLYGAGVAGDPAVSLGDTLHLRNTGVTSATGTANQVIVSNATGDITLSLPQDIHTGATPTFGGIIVDSLRTKKAGIDGDLDVAGATRLGGSLAVTGPEVNLPAGSVDNAELANSSIGLLYGAGLSGDATVSLGDTLNIRNTGVTSITGTANQVIADRTSGDVTLSLPQDIHTGATPTFGGVIVDSIKANNLKLDGNLTVTGATTLGGNLTVTGPEVQLPAGSVDNSELAHSSIGVQYGSGLAGDASVALGDTLHLRNTGVTSATGTANQVIVDRSTGDVTFSLPQDIHTGATPTFAGVTADSVITNRLTLTGNLNVPGTATIGGDLTVGGPGVSLPAGSVDNSELANSSIGVQYGSGLAGDASVALGDTLNLRNTGVTSATGTANQVIVSNTTGDITLSLPQDIHVGASPAFAGITLSGLVATSGSDTILVSNGGIVESRTFASLASGIGGSFWGINGNGTTTPGTNFIGTTDNQPFQIHVDNDNASATNGRGRVMRYEPNATSPNIIGGFSGNSVASGSFGGVIGGGGYSGSPNSIASHFGTIAGGHLNSIATGSDLGTIGGGNGNTIGTGAFRSTISGGVNNGIGTNSYQVSIGGGALNKVGDNSRDVVIGGGGINWVGANSAWGVIGGGYRNYIRDNASYSTIAGGIQDTIHDNSGSSTIGGGIFNAIAANSSTSTIAGGSNNKVAASAPTSTIAGGYRNYVATGAGSSTIGGGENDSIGTGSWQSTIAGGGLNTIGASSWQSTISGGSAHSIGSNAAGSTIGGGSSNAIGANARLSAIPGGRGLTLNGRGSFGFLGGNNTGTLNMTVADNDIAVFGNTDLWLASNDNVPSQLRFYSSYNAAGAFPNGTKHISMEAPTGLISDIRYILPDTTGIAGDLLKVKSVSGSTVTLDWDAAAVTASTGWERTGNAGTVAGTNFIGTTDNQPFQIHVDNANASTSNGRGRVMRYEPNATSPNIIGGFSGNSISSGVVGATIAGGGRNGQSNSIGSQFSTISGGNKNTIATNTEYATVGGGSSNTVLVDALRSTIGGGLLNTIGSRNSTIAGGVMNSIGASSANSTIAGGTNDTVESGTLTATIAGGNGNIIRSGAMLSTISGGYLNTIGSSSRSASISGGESNTLGSSSDFGTVGGGYKNSIESSAISGTIGGGANNTIRSNAGQSTIGGGESNLIGTGAYHSTIAGGYQNVLAANARWSTIGGGEENYIGSLSSTIAGGTHDTVENAQNAFIGGGDHNLIRHLAQFSIIVGGRHNEADTAAEWSFIGGGEYNAVQGSDAVVSGGRYNTVAGTASAIAGGRGLTLRGAGSFGFLGGNIGLNDMTVSAANVAAFGNTDLWLANNDGAASQLRFYESNSTPGDFPGAANYTSFSAQEQSADIEYILPAATGIISDQLTINAVAGNQITLGWSAPSDRRIKSDLLKLDGEDLLGRFRGLELGTWRYTNDPSGRRHYGIMAQDFHRLFGSDALGTIGTDTTVNNIDLIGVSYLAIQGLEERTNRNTGEIGELKELLRTMREEIDALQEENRRLRERMR